jgi:hypothetical protein
MSDCLPPFKADTVCTEISAGPMGTNEFVSFKYTQMHRGGLRTVRSRSDEGNPIKVRMIAPITSELDLQAPGPEKRPHEVRPDVATSEDANRSADREGFRDRDEKVPCVFPESL